MIHLSRADGLFGRHRVRVDGADHGPALPHQISRHAHPKARPETPAEAPRPTTGIDYLGLLDVQHTATLAGRVNYAALTDQPPAPQPPS